MERSKIENYYFKYSANGPLMSGIQPKALYENVDFIDCTFHYNCEGQVIFKDCTFTSCNGMWKPTNTI